MASVETLHYLRDWTKPSDVPRLNSHELHVWRLNIADARAAVAVERLAGNLQQKEHARAARFLFPVERHRFLAGRGLVRHLLGDYCQCSPSDISLGYTVAGKPYESENQVYFNISHAGDWIVAAFATSTDVGVDVEQWHDEDHSAIIHSHFHPNEIQEWETWPPQERIACFYSAWTRKEAYLKALGVGLSRRLWSFSVDTRPGVLQPRLFDSECANNYGFRLCDLPMPRGYSAALAYHESIRTVRTFEYV